MFHWIIHIARLISTNSPHDIQLNRNLLLTFYAHTIRAYGDVLLRCGCGFLLWAYRHRATLYLPVSEEYIWRQCNSDKMWVIMIWIPEPSILHANRQNQILHKKYLFIKKTWLKNFTFNLMYIPALTFWRASYKAFLCLLWKNWLHNQETKQDKHAYQFRLFFSLIKLCFYNNIT